MDTSFASYQYTSTWTLKHLEDKHRSWPRRTDSGICLAFSRTTARPKVLVNMKHEEQHNAWHKHEEMFSTKWKLTANKIRLMSNSDLFREPVETLRTFSTSKMLHVAQANAGRNHDFEVLWFHCYFISWELWKESGIVIAFLRGGRRIEDWAFRLTCCTLSSITSSFKLLRFPWDHPTTTDINIGRLSQHDCTSQNAYMAYQHYLNLMRFNNESMFGSS